MGRQSGCWPVLTVRIKPLPKTYTGASLASPLSTTVLAMTRAVLMPLPLRAALLAACLTSPALAADASRPGPGSVPSAPGTQLSTPAAPAQAAVQTTPAPGAPVQLVGAATADSGVNPFNGKPLSYEAMLRELELQKVRTALLEENLRATNLSAEIQNVPTRKAAEVAQAQTQIARERAQAATIDREAQAARQVERAATDNATKGAQGAASTASKKGPKKSATATRGDMPSDVSSSSGGPGGRPTVSMPSMAMPSVELVSVVVTPRQRSALVNIAGNVVPLSEGEVVPQLGQVKIIDADTVLVGGQALRVKSATLGRLHVPEQAIQPGLAGPGAAGYVNPALFASTLAQNASAGVNTGVLPPPVPGATGAGRTTAAPTMPAYVAPRPGQ